MTKDVSRFTRAAYCLAILGAVLPFGLAASGWAMLAAGAGPMLAVPYIGPILLLTVGLYRIWVVIRSPRTLTCPSASGFAALMRSVGVLFMYVGAACAILSWVSGPLIHSLIRSHSDSGAEFFVVGAYLGIFGRTGLLGVILFELSRLRSFEMQAQGV